MYSGWTCWGSRTTKASTAPGQTGRTYVLDLNKTYAPTRGLIRPESMSYDEFIALNPGLLWHPAKAIPRRHRQVAPGADASAIQGRLSAQVAFLQSQYLSAAHPPYFQHSNSRNLPVDNSDTCSLFTGYWS